ncbi:hypothetical protein B0A55_03916 [Friedmanniomyces simplex]|uniref:Uncharacterized protein n=1 Tax=Friedmanniomyces simplex TaxID=329884 RepID=A0A4U0XNF9_9PEZI|nr:hypothetical protein B0A55_03916 [Friedmanniomyces simplex]
MRVLLSQSTFPFFGKPKRNFETSSQSVMPQVKPAGDSLRTSSHDLRDALTPESGPVICINNANRPTKIPGVKILSTWKAVRREAVQILYGRNTFRIDVLSVNNTWIVPSDREYPPQTSNLRTDMCHPGLLPQLKGINGKYFHLIREVQFAYHVEAPYELMDEKTHRDRVFAWPMVASLTLHAQLLAQRKPCFRLSVVAAESMEARPEVLDDFLERHGPDWQNTCGEGGRLAKEKILELAYSVREICDHIGVGTEGHRVGGRTLRQRAGMSFVGLEDVDEPELEAWEGGASAITTGDLASLSRYDGNAAEAWHHTIRVQNHDAFTNRPVILYEGLCKDHKALVLEPYTKAFRFLDLPPELRAMVYDMLLKEPMPIDMSTYKPNHKPRHPCRTTFRDKKLHAASNWDSKIGKWLDQPPSSATSLCRINRQKGPVTTVVKDAPFPSCLKALRIYARSIYVTHCYAVPPGVSYWVWPL